MRGGLERVRFCMVSLDDLCESLYELDFKSEAGKAHSIVASSKGAIKEKMFNAIGAWIDKNTMLVYKEE